MNTQTDHAPMVARGLRLPPYVWERIDRLASQDRRKPGDWLRMQIEALLSRVPEVHDVAEKVPSATNTDTVEIE